MSRKAATGVGVTGVGAEPVFANPQIPPTPVNGPLLHSLPGKTYNSDFEIRNKAETYLKRSFLEIAVPLRGTASSMTLQLSMFLHYLWFETRV